MEFILTTLDKNSVEHTQTMTADSVLDAGEAACDLIPAGHTYVSVSVVSSGTPLQTGAQKLIELGLTVDEIQALAGVPIVVD